MQISIQPGQASGSPGEHQCRRGRQQHFPRQQHRSRRVRFGEWPCVEKVCELVTVRCSAVAMAQAPHMPHKTGCQEAWLRDNQQTWPVVISAPSSLPVRSSLRMSRASVLHALPSCSRFQVLVPPCFTVLLSSATCCSSKTHTCASASSHPLSTSLSNISHAAAAPL